MNVLVAIVGIIFIVCIFIGYKHGLFRSALKLVLLVLSLFLSYFLSPMLADVIIKYTNVDEYFKAKAYSVIEKTVKENVEENLKNELGIASEDVVEELTDEALKADPAKVQQVNIINKMNVPEFIKTALMDNNHDDTRKSLGVTSFYEYISTYISYMIINAMVFVLSFVVLLIIFAIVSIISAVAMRIPIIGGINRLGGMLFGFFEALFIVWVFFVLVAIIPGTQIGNWFFSQIDDSTILTILYEKNIFMKVVTGLNNLL